MGGGLTGPASRLEEEDGWEGEGRHSLSKAVGSRSTWL